MVEYLYSYLIYIHTISIYYYVYTLLLLVCFIVVIASLPKNLLFYLYKNFFVNFKRIMMSKRIMCIDRPSKISSKYYYHIIHFIYNLVYTSILCPPSVWLIIPVKLVKLSPVITINHYS